MGFAAPALAIGGSIIGAVGAIGEGNARADAYGSQASMAAYQAQVARNNETISNQLAEHEIAVGQRGGETESMKTAARMAKIKTGFAARGVDVNTGSAVDVQASEREIGKLDAETVLSNAALKAYGYRSRAMGYRADADLASASERNLYASASSARTGGYLKAAGTLMSGASQLPLGKWFGGATTAPSGGTAP